MSEHEWIAGTVDLLAVKSRFHMVDLHFYW